MAAILFLSYEFAQHFSILIKHFPFQFIACSFIIYQIGEYILSFNKNRRIIMGILSLLSIIGITYLYFTL